MAAHKPDIVVRRDPTGRWFGQCLSCMDASKPSFHKPIADAWRKTHITSSTQPQEAR